MKKNNLLICILSFIYIIWTILVLSNNISWFDEPIYNFIIGFKSDVVTYIMKVFTMLASTSFMVVIAICSVIYLLYHKKKWYFFACLLGLNAILNQSFKFICRRDRPDHLRLVKESGYSYPSGHSMIAMFLYGFFIRLIIDSNIKKTNKCLLIGGLCTLILFVGISRIYLGVHYPSDVFGGYLLSLIFVIYSYNFCKKVNCL